MAATPICCKSASADAPVALADDPFSPMVVLDYYDGPAAGFLKCKVCGAAYYFYMLDWDSTHVMRIFALAPIPEGSYQRVLAALKANPDRHVWFPPVLSRPSEETIAELYQNGLQEAIDTAATPTLAIAWSIRAERTLALRCIDPAAAPDLSAWFDRPSQAVEFDWFAYLRVARLLQRA